MQSPSLILAYHGCDRTLAENIVLGQDNISPSERDYNWLGSGAYFWENDPWRALQWAKGIQARPQHDKHKIHDPAVVGAIINPGNCLDLTDTESLRLVKDSYEVYRLVQKYSEEKKLPENERGFSGDEDLVKRHLDCAVINFLHQMRSGPVAKQLLSIRSGAPLVKVGLYFPILR